MIRLLLYSNNPELQLLLAPTIGEEFSLFHERRMDRIRQIISQGQCDVVILDLDSGSYPIQQQLGYFDEIRELGVPVVLMTDDDSRATAMDLVQRGVYNYIRTPAIARFRLRPAGRLQRQLSSGLQPYPARGRSGRSGADHG
jgi:DNA-binding NtrC family response regulator